MPSFFFHLVLELYQQSSKHHFNFNEQQSDVYLPPAGSNIFTSLLPHHHHPGNSHRISSVSNRNRREAAHISKISEKDSIKSNLSSPSQQNFSQTSWDKSGESSFHGPFSAELVHRSAVKSIPRNANTAKDWRFDQVSIEGIDMTFTSTSSEDRGRRKAVDYMDNSAGAGLATKGRFVPSDPRNTEVGWGIVHLYRDAEETPGLYDDVVEGSHGGPDMAASAITIPTNAQPEWKEEDCTTLCILAVPSYLTPSDFLGFIGEKTKEHVSHIRMIRTGRINRYMVLMKFRQAKMAREWRKEWNGKVFNSTEPEYCHVVFIKSIEFQTPNIETDSNKFPDNTNDPFTPRSGVGLGSVKTSIPQPLSSTPASSLTTKPFAPPTPSLVEMPTCPVCLERMDETTGLLTILCQHVFHCACLQKWQGSGCPVCRFTQGSGIGKSKLEYTSCEEDCSEQICSICASDSNLWICLICGNVGCGRYDQAHAFSHYKETSHCYAMDIATQRVWDYAGDGYVHRLIQNEADGKVVELPSTMIGVKDARDDDAEYVPREKIDNIGREYSHLLTSQLDSQRMYFEEKVAQAADKASEASAAADKASETTRSATQALVELQGSFDTLRNDLMPSIERDKDRAEKRASKFMEMARTMEKQWKEEKTVNESLLERVRFLDTEMEKLKAERDDLAEQNRDLTFYITSAEKLREAGAGEDIVEGTVSVAEAPAPEKKRKGKGRK